MDSSTFQFAKSVHDQVLRNVPAEKARAVLKQAEIARALQFEGEQKVDGLGQHIGRVDARTFMRWWQQYNGCWNDPAFIKEFLKNNKCYQAAGYRI